MKTIPHPSAPPQSKPAHAYQHEPLEDEAEQSDLKPLTRQEAQQWRERHAGVTVWIVVKWQLAMTLLATLGAALLTWQAQVVWSVLYGALCILLPTALMAYGLTSSALARWLRSSRHQGAGSALAGLFVWEGVKLLLALAMLLSAPLLVPDLNWIALLVGLVVVLKAYWLGLWQRSQPKHQLG